MLDLCCDAAYLMMTVCQSLKSWNLTMLNVDDTILMLMDRIRSDDMNEECLWT